VTPETPTHNSTRNVQFTVALIPTADRIRPVRPAFHRYRPVCTDRASSESLPDAEFPMYGFRLDLCLVHWPVAQRSAIISSICTPPFFAAGREGRGRGN
jgi:hypothetical protein